MGWDVFIHSRRLSISCCDSVNSSNASLIRADRSGLSLSSCNFNKSSNVESIFANRRFLDLH
jgi:hypothetical protein